MKKKGFFGKMIDKFDKKLEKKSEEKKCCCCCGDEKCSDKD
ncbi:MAG: hypothetical protein ABIJ08_05185 [Nanoarchaeota archaeon]